MDSTTLVHPPVREDRILDVQRLTPRPEPVDVLGGLGPELLRLVPGRGEGSAVRRVGRVAPAGRVYCRGPPRSFPARRAPPLQRGARVQAHGESEVCAHVVVVVVVVVPSPCSLAVHTQTEIFSSCRGGIPTSPPFTYLSLATSSQATTYIMCA